MLTSVWTKTYLLNVRVKGRWNTKTEILGDLNTINNSECSTSSWGLGCGYNSQHSSEMYPEVQWGKFHVSQVTAAVVMQKHQLSQENYMCNSLIPPNISSNFCYHWIWSISRLLCQNAPCKMENINVCKFVKSSETTHLFCISFSESRSLSSEIHSSEHL